MEILYDGACILFITGRIGSSCLCVFMYAFNLGAVCFMFIKYLCLIIRLVCCISVGLAGFVFEKGPWDPYLGV